MAGHRDALGPAILIDSSLPNDALNRVAIRNSVAEPLEYHRCNAFTTKAIYQNPFVVGVVEIGDGLPSIAICRSIPHATSSCR